MKGLLVRIDFMDLGYAADGGVDYEHAWQVQRQTHADVVAGRRAGTVLLLEHAPVYTAGRLTEPLDRPFDGTPVIDVDRGGKITWHGPGQLTGYPILRLDDPIDVVAYVRRLESMLIDVCDRFAVTTGRVPGRSGVWVPADGFGPERKVAAIGIRVAKGVTMHGFALNCDCALSAFDKIVPCGIRDAGVTSLTAEVTRRDPQAAPIRVADVLPAVRAAVERHLPAGGGPATLAG